MRIKTSFLVMAFAMLLCFTSSCTDDLVDYDVYCTISGTVIDLDTHDPVQSATVAQADITPTQVMTDVLSSSTLTLANIL